MNARLRSALRGVYAAIPGKAVLFEVLRRAAPVPERVYRHLHFEGVFRVRGPGGGFLMQHRGNQLENEVFWSGLSGGWESETIAVWRDLAADARCVFDIGAHSGLFALVAAEANPDASVVAFEPVAPVFDRLRENARLNGDRVRCVRAAVSDREGVVSLFTPEGDSPLSASLEAGFLVDHPKTVEEVACVTLDRFVEREGLVPDLVKIDVEGHEPGVLRGMTETLRRHRPPLVVEVLTSGTAEALGSVLSPLGYRAYDIVPGGEVRPLDDAWRPASAGNLLLRVQ